MRLKLAILGWLFLFLILALMRIDAVSAAQIDDLKQEAEPEVTWVTVVDTTPVDPRAIPPEPPESSEIKLGDFIITYYCPCEICCGKSDGITYSGRKAKQGMTIAVDPDVIPLGSKVHIEGIGDRIAMDTGAFGGQQIDVFVNDHQKALDLGKHLAEVTLKKEAQ